MENQTYIAFLRAVNVGGRVVKMERIRALFAELGFGSVRSYIQSGNVFFDTAETDRAALTRRIETHLADALGFEVAAMVRSVPEVEAALATDPFRGVEETPDGRLCVVFLSEPVPVPAALPLTSPKGDCQVVAVTGAEIFLVLHLVNGRPADAGAFLAGAFGSSDAKATMRYYGTTQKILRAAKGEKP